MSRESDLLFGLLALQMNFVTREQLLECAAVWMGDPSRDIGRMLAERGHLKEFQRTAVAAMVEAQLRSHDGDPSISLAAASVDSSVREGLLGLEPPEDLKKSLIAGVGPIDPGRYRVGRELGSGGLGRVVEAFDTHFEREIALKLLKEQADPEMRERFVREAKLAGRLDHPNIVPVHDFGIMAGPNKPLFLAMKRVRGRDLGKALASLAQGDATALREYSRLRLLQIFQEVCLGVAFAHDRGVIHRDLKPANVMLGDYGEVLVVDWGLARVLGESPPSHAAALPDSSLSIAADPDATVALPPPSSRGASGSALTFEGQILGTPSYMPPEQAEGRHQDCDARSDIYSLGAILFEILTFAPPFRGRTARETLKLVLRGKLEAPSARAPAVAPELDAICVRALAFRREDRFQTAQDLHHEVQVFLEGVRERERKEKESLERIANGRAQLGRYRDLSVEIESQTKAVKELSDIIKVHQTVEEKRPLWDAEQRLRHLREERVIAFSSASEEFGQALIVKPDSAEALEGKCELFLDRFLETERRRDREETLLNLRTLTPFDRDGRYRARLEAPGSVSLRTFAYACDCLNPVRHPEWRVDIAEACTVPWREGRARPDLALTDRDRPVPAVRTTPEGVRWGHADTCRLSEFRGAEVRIARYEERDKRLLPGESKLIGTTPLAGFELSQGSWICTIRAAGYAEARVPIRIDRSASWTQDVTLYRQDEIPPGFCCVPSGPFIFGGEHAGGQTEETRVTEDVFIGRFPITALEYLEFLNDLRATSQSEEAIRRQPREGDARYFAETAAGFALPSPDDPKALLKGPSFPVLGVSWADALAYASWRSKRDGLAYSLPHEEEWEKAARGVDARTHPYGNHYDGTYSHTNLSMPDGMRPLAVGSFPVDESPYGVRDLAGGVVNWLLNAPEVPQRDYVCMRGGSWGTAPHRAQSAWRLAFHPTIAYRFYGFRLALRPRARSSKASRGSVHVEGM